MITENAVDEHSGSNTESKMQSSITETECSRHNWIQHMENIPDDHKNAEDDLNKRLS